MCCVLTNPISYKIAKIFEKIPKKIVKLRVLTAKTKYDKILNEK